MRRPLVAGNWKMNGSLQSIAALVDGIAAEAGQLQHVQIAVCPPFVHLCHVAPRIESTPIALGAQDCSQHDAGAYTGDVAAPMLKELGCRYVIVGHSERRQYQRESDELVAAKFARALEHGLTPIACVGETLAEREADATEQVIARQLDAILRVRGASALNVAVVAYEPVWAIGTGRNATPEQAQAVHAFIRARIASHDQATAEAVQILYGGSVKATNAAELFTANDIDGGLIGGASLNAAEFVAICSAAEA